MLGEKSATKFVVLTMHKDKDFFNDAMKTGVSGYLLKNHAITELVTCVKEVLAGRSYVSAGSSSILC